MNNNAYSWYANLIKPFWAPPSLVFGPVWTVLYAIIAVTFGTVFYKVYVKQLPVLLAVPFIFNLIFNFAFTPLQFGLRNNLLASIDILLIVCTLAWALFGIWHASTSLRWIVYANIPYILWATFATVLQLTITYLNR